ncbi:DsbA family protein [Pararhizobium haloflavum]|uniref:DsbA family protein n=1 Tax=Pararhizobium haloflavum TaxID=2037914 RepID=UPI000C18D18E|nr:thioredoxin domain-containing protein [Pararhizobium haloflavum]
MTRRSIVLLTGLVALIVFAGGAFFYDRYGGHPAQPVAAAQDDALVRAHSPIIGPVDASVTIVEFFDPSCEACRAFYPAVKQIMANFPDETRLVIRYTPFHEGSEEAVRILETARLQDRYEPVLEALLARQPEWAVHGAPDLEKAWEIAGAAGLDVEQARREMSSAEIDAVLEQDLADVQSNNVRQTPTFFVNGRLLESFGPQQLYDLVREEVESARAAQ